MDRNEKMDKNVIKRDKNGYKSIKFVSFLPLVIQQKMWPAIRFMSSIGDFWKTAINISFKYGCIKLITCTEKCFAR
jgi:hypothetical protein